MVAYLDAAFLFVLPSTLADGIVVAGCTEEVQLPDSAQSRTAVDMGCDSVVRSSGSALRPYAAEVGKTFRHRRIAGLLLSLASVVWNGHVLSQTCWTSIELAQVPSVQLPADRISAVRS